MITSDKSLSQKLDRLIDENLENPSFSIDTLCQSLGVSRSQLHRTIKEQSQTSASLYIRRRRMLKAQHLLVTTDLRISEISDRVGFSNPQNFSTYFTEEFRVSPTEFRKLPAGLPLLPAETETHAPTETEPEVGTPPLPVLIHTPGPRWWRRRGVLSVGVAAGLLLILGAGLYGWRQAWFVGRPAKPVGNSLAVLPFANLGGADSKRACEGLMDNMHTSVSLLQNLRVTSRMSSDQYENTRKSIWQIGDELQVANLLKGSVLKTNDQLQVKLELINAGDDVRVWTKTYSVPYRDIFQLTDQMVRDVADQLKTTIGASPADRLIPVRTANLDAYNLLLQGRQLLISRTTADIQAALSRFDRALRLDSAFADTYACKAVAYHLLMGTKMADTQPLNRLTEENALAAIRLDPANSIAYGVLGSLYYSTYEWQASENAFRIALQHNPNDAQANYWYSLLLRTLGRVDEAVQYSTQAVALDPLHPIMMGGHITNCVYANRTDLVKANIANGRGLFEYSFSYRVSTAYDALHRQDYEQAVARFQQALALNPEEKGQIPLLIYAEVKRGNRQRAIDFLRQLSDTPRADYERAVVYAGLNQADSSMHYLKKAADRGYLYRDTKVIDPLRPYHSHPVFRAVMRRFKLPE